MKIGEGAREVVRLRRQSQEALVKREVVKKVVTADLAIDRFEIQSALRKGDVDLLIVSQQMEGGRAVVLDHNPHPELLWNDDLVEEALALSCRVVVIDSREDGLPVDCLALLRKAA